MKSIYPKTGVTLIELLIVVIIIGILASISLPVMTKTIEKAKTCEVVANLNLIRAAEKSYFLENGEFSDAWDGEEGLNIENPNEEAGCSFNYEIAVEDDDFTVTAQRLENAPAPYNGYWYIIRKDGQIFSNGPFFPELPELILFKK